MDNRISNELLKVLDTNQTTYQLLPPHTHWRNLAERAIQTLKNHFKAGLSSMNPSFPLSESDWLIEQANVTLNLLESARTNPKLSAYSYIFGGFNFSATSMVPPGTKVVAHIKPHNQGTWELNGEVGWYMKPSMLVKEQVPASTLQSHSKQQQKYDSTTQSCIHTHYDHCIRIEGQTINILLCNISLLSIFFNLK